MRVRTPEDGVYVASAKVRVGYVDTDRAQVVHHSTYLRYLEMARVEYLRERGFDYRQLEFEQGISLAVVEATVRYRVGAGFDDELELRTSIGLANRAKLRFDTVILRGAEVVVTAAITTCCVRLVEKRACSLPASLLALAGVR
jgi:acyl-CoA thioester hydrolase